MVNGEPDARAITDYRDLDVWNEAMGLTVDIYEVTRTFPREEMFGLTSQMRRAASSIPANIAEGFGRQQTRSFIQFLRIAQGSLKELETHIEVARRVSMLSGEKASLLLVRCERIGRMLIGLVRALERREART